MWGAACVIDAQHPYALTRAVVSRPRFQHVLEVLMFHLYLPIRQPCWTACEA